MNVPVLAAVPRISCRLHGRVRLQFSSRKRERHSAVLFLCLKWVFCGGRRCSESAHVSMLNKDVLRKVFYAGEWFVKTKRSVWKTGLTAVSVVSKSCSCHVGLYGSTWFHRLGSTARFVRARVCVCVCVCGNDCPLSIIISKNESSDTHYS